MVPPSDVEFQVFNNFSLNTDKTLNTVAQHVEDNCARDLSRLPAGRVQNPKCMPGSCSVYLQIGTNGGNHHASSRFENFHVSICDTGYTHPFGLAQCLLLPQAHSTDCREWKEPQPHAFFSWIGPHARLLQYVTFNSTMGFSSIILIINNLNGSNHWADAVISVLLRFGIAGDIPHCRGVCYPPDGVIEG